MGESSGIQAWRWVCVGEAGDLEEEMYKAKKSLETPNV